MNKLGDAVREAVTRPRYRAAALHMSLEVALDDGAREVVELVDRMAM